MPFNSFARSFTAVNIERDAPAASGVYGISDSQRWILIDETENIRASLMEQFAHFSQGADGPPTGFSFELSPSYTRVARRDRLVAELQPLQKHTPAGVPQQRDRMNRS